MQTMNCIGFDVHERTISYCGLCGAAKFGEHRAVHAAVQAAQQAFAGDADRGGKDGAALQPGAGSDSLF
jgi:hypothetical protein